MYLNGSINDNKIKIIIIIIIIIIISVFLFTFIHIGGFLVLKAMSMKSSVFWVVTLCRAGKAQFATCLSSFFLGLPFGLGNGGFRFI
jgi:hypothetical protein